MDKRKIIQEKIEIRKLLENDIPLIVSAFAEIRWNKPASQYKKYLKEQTDQERQVWVAWMDSVFVGYVTLKWRSDYLPFQEKQIPEINDLNVLPKYQQQGVGSKLMDLVEHEAATKSQVVGIGVGLYTDYGHAQQMYVKRGYVPDGNGITYKNKVIDWGEKIIADDDLVLWFIKKLKI